MIKLKNVFYYLIIFLSCVTGSSYTQSLSPLTLSEIMFNPAETNCEFIEIYNTSSAQSVDLSGYKIKYYTSSNNNLTTVSGGTTLAPGKYAVIIQGSYNFNSGIYKTLIPEGTVILKTSGNNFGSSGMSNTTSRVVNLVDPGGMTIDTYIYSANNSAGFSDEKIEMNKDNNFSNWGNSLIENGTPGFKNSISPVVYDLSIISFTFSPLIPVAEDSLTINAAIKNIGKNTASNFFVNIYYDVNKDSIGQPDENIFSESYLNLFSNDSVMVSKIFYTNTAGVYSFIAEVTFNQDENGLNNRSIMEVNVIEKPAEPLELVINEVMYAPGGDEPEWIEIYNRSFRSLNLKDYIIGDNSLTVKISVQDLILYAGGYLVISDDVSINDYYDISSTVVVKSLPSLSNNGDNIILRNNFNSTVDSINYFPEWGGTGGLSLERISVNFSTPDTANWKSSTSRFKATPGRINSVSEKKYDLSLLSFSAGMSYVEIGKSIGVKISIGNNGTASAMDFFIKIYLDSNNNLIGDADELIEDFHVVQLNSKSSQEFDFNVQGFAAGKNTLITSVDFSEDQYTDNNMSSLDITGVVLNERPGDLVINEIMYAPISPEPEWIEVFNNSNKEINLKEYQIADDASKNKVVSESLTLKPGGYLVFARDSLIISRYGSISNLVITNFPSLNNSGDRITLIDSLGRTIDSLEFISGRGGVGGHSLERISPEVSSQDINNWKTSESRFNATPGRVNSISEKEYDLTVISITSDAEYIEYGNIVNLEVIIENLGKESAKNCSLKLYLDRNKNSTAEVDELIDEFQNFYLPSGNMTEVEFHVGILELGINEFITVIDFIEDDYLDNNTANLKLKVVVLNEVRGDLIINEIMHSPILPEPEWIEIYNRSAKEIELKGYSLSNDEHSTIVMLSSLIVKPEEYFVIARDSSLVSIYHDLNNVLVVQFSSLNNSGGKIILSDSLGRIIDSLVYKSAWGGNNGKSLERYNAFYSSTDSTNWKSSLAENGGSPGRINTISKKNIDGAVVGLMFTPINPIAGQDVTIKTQTANLGKDDISAKIILYEIIADGIKQKIEESSLMLIPPDTTIMYDFDYKINSILTGHKFEVNLELPGDEDLSNNNLTSIVHPGYLPNSVLLNEIMFSPVNGEPEWIELYNTLDFDVELNEWIITDILTKPSAAIISEAIIPKKSLIIITKDSSIVNHHADIPSAIYVNGFANLNNDEDGIALKDSRGVTIDSVFYNKTWGGENGKSIERKSLSDLSNSKSNWVSSVDIELSTPGRINSVSLKDYDIAVKDFYSLEKYVELGKSGRIKVIVENPGKMDAEKYSLILSRIVSLNESGLISEEIIDSIQLTNLSPAGIKEVEFIINDFEEGQNIFIAKIFFDKDQYAGNNISLQLKINAVRINEVREDLILNEIMYAPLSPEPEWIEIYNKSQKRIDLKNYNIGNGTNKKNITSISLIINPGEYFIVAGDSIFYSIYENTSKVLIADFPSLKNSGDIIALTDSLGRVIDSVNYSYTWGGGSGKSLERINASLPSTDSTNWATAFLPKGGSPGKINTISRKDVDCAVTKIIFTPLRPLIGDEVKVAAEVFNCGKNNIAVTLILYELTANSSKTKIEESLQINISTGGSAKYEFNYIVNSINSQQTFEVYLELPGDEDETNNTVTSDIRPGYKPYSVLLNEIMFNPVNGEPEWIELYNNSDYDINFGDWSITDLITTPIKTNIKACIIPKNSFLVVTKDSSIVNYHQSIPSVILVNGFANLNNDEDGVVLKDLYDVTIDSISYDKTWGAGNGKSIERKSFNLPTFDKANWAYSNDIELSTPGRINSVVQKEYDLSVVSIKTIPEFPVYGDYIYLTAGIRNVGLKYAADFSITFSMINETDTTLLEMINVTGLDACDSLSVSTSSRIILTESKTVLCSINFNPDQEISNNYLSKIIEIGCKSFDVLISEIMYNPLDGESEWVEIVNNSASSINLKNWSASDLINPVKGIIAERDVLLKPNEYAVLTPDTNKYQFIPPNKFFQTKFGSLGNTSDGFIIYDNRGMVIDSVVYNSKMNCPKGFSIERISLSVLSCDSTNWSTSLNVNGATPGITNSISTITGYYRNSLVINEIMFDPASGNSEFIEFYNPTNDTIQLGGMTLQIGNENTFKLSSTFYQAFPKSYFVLASDSSLANNYSFQIDYLLTTGSLNLSNDGTLLMLRDMPGNCIDSITYSPGWHNKNILSIKNRSLERLNPSLNSNDRMNWSTSVNQEGATPGKQNSVFVQNISGGAKVNINPNPFSPDNDGFEDFTTINFNLTKPLAQVRIKVFDSIGRLVRTLTHNLPAASNNTIIFNGLDDSGRALRIGIYILLIEAVADDGSTETIKTPVVIARKL